MPFCPKCRFEYEFGAVVCPDCDEKLVASLKPAPGDDDLDETFPSEEMVPLARMTSRDKAEMLLEALRQASIPAYLHSETGYFGATGQMGVSSYQPVGGGFLLMVHRDHVDEADTFGVGMFGDEWDDLRLVDIE